MNAFFHYVAVGYQQVWGFGGGIVVGVIVFYMTRDLAKPLSWLLIILIAFLLVPWLVGALLVHWQQIDLPFS